MQYRNNLAWVNIGNSTANIQLGILELIKDRFEKDIITLEIGSAYGGAVEMMAKLLGDRGKAYGYDTFEGHPEDLSDDKNSDEARAMDILYKEFGRDMLKYEYQRKVLDDQGLDNAILVKGRVNKHSFDDIEKAHLVMFDMDLIKPTRVAYNALKDKIIPKGFLFFHDALPPTHLPMIYHYVYDEVMRDKSLEIYGEFPASYLTVLEKM